MNKDNTKNSMEKMELSMDALSQISGGYFTEDAEEYLHQVIGKYINDQKKMNIQPTADDTSAYFLSNYDTVMSDYKYVSQKELDAYIKENWGWF